MLHSFFKKNKFTVAVFILVLFFGFFPKIQADVPPRITVTGLTITGVTGNTITGQFFVSNNEDYYLSDLNYEIRLFQGTDFATMSLIDTAVVPGNFFVASYQTVTKSFAYNYPANIVSGNYTIQIQIINSGGNELGWQNQTVSLKGSGKFLNIIDASSQLLVNGKPYTTVEGVNVFPQDTVTVSLKVQNMGDAITVVPQIKIYGRQVNMSLVKEYQDSSVVFAKGETKEINLTMPKLDVPESYLAEIIFYQGGQQVSGLQNFRWVVKGPGGKILYVKADKDYYKKGENIQITIDSIGPADGSDIGQGQLEISIFDKNGNLVGKTSKEVALNNNSIESVISVTAPEDLVSPKIDVDLVQNGKTLSTQSITLPIFSTQAQAIAKEAGKSASFNEIIAIVLVLVILIAAFLFYKLKFKGKK